MMRRDRLGRFQDRASLKVEQHAIGVCAAGVYSQNQISHDGFKLTQEVRLV